MTDPAGPVPVVAPETIGEIEPLDLLVVAPHPDDAELGMGGTIAKMIDAGRRVGILDLTSGEPTPHGDPVRRHAETTAASYALAGPANELAWRGNAGMPNRQLQPSLDNRQRLAGYFRRLRPRMIFAPYWVDAHPDHAAATELVEAARFWSKLTKTDQPGQLPLAGERFHPPRIFYYFCIHLRIVVEPHWIVDISDVWPRKRKAIEAYESQFIDGRDPGPPSMIDGFETTARYWGQMIARRYGEPFATREPIGLTTLDAIV